MTQRSRRGNQPAAKDETIRPEVHRAVHKRTAQPHEQSAPRESAALRTLGVVRRGFWAVMAILAVSACAFFLQEWLSG